MSYIYLEPTPERALRWLGIRELRDAQEKPLDAILHGRDTFVQMPTGHGKSLLYQLPALVCSPRLTLVISPLKALQADQVAALQAKGVRAQLLNSGLSAAERARVLQAVRQQQVTLLYIAPEQLGNCETRETLLAAEIVLVAVDEAHILAHDQRSFRKAYRKIGKFIAKLSQRPVVAAFTATATTHDRQIIVDSLKMKDPAIFHTPMRRKNLHLLVKKVDSASKTGKENHVWKVKRQIAGCFLKEWDQQGSAIIYVPTVSGVKRVYRWLKARGWNVGKYHGKQPDKKRAAAQADFMSGKIKIMVATNAFGLGIDKPDIRLIIHVGLPLSMDGYVQEIGRAGRDGETARCVLIWAPSDLLANRATLQHGTKGKQRPAALARLDALYQLVRSRDCLWRGIEHCFGESPGKRCSCCCNCKTKKYKKNSKIPE